MDKGQDFYFVCLFILGLIGTHDTYTSLTSSPPPPPPHLPPHPTTIYTRQGEVGEVGDLSETDITHPSPSSPATCHDSVAWQCGDVGVTFFLLLPTPTPPSPPGSFPPPPPPPCCVCLPLLPSRPDSPSACCQFPTYHLPSAPTFPYHPPHTYLPLPAPPPCAHSPTCAFLLCVPSLPAFPTPTTCAFAPFTFCPRLPLPIPTTPTQPGGQGQEDKHYFPSPCLLVPSLVGD